MQDETEAPALTEAQIKAWDATQQVGCPNGGDDPTTDNREFDSLQIEGARCWQNVNCNRCGATWQLLYDLTGVDVGRGEGPEYPLPLLRERKTAEIITNLLAALKAWDQVAGEPAHLGGTLRACAMQGRAAIAKAQGA